MSSPQAITTMKWTIGDDGKWHRMPFIRTGNSDKLLREAAKS